MIRIISEGIPIGSFQNKKDAQDALQYIDLGFIKED